jgi:hypothetical protein
MSPASETNMSSSSSVKILNLPKLRDDGSNWITYKERIMNTLTHKGLRRHVIGNAKKPVVPVLREDGEYYLPNGKDALKDDELEKLQETEDDFLKKEASVREVLYETIPEKDTSKKGKKKAAVVKKVVRRPVS